MERKIIITNDGSSTIHLPDWNEQYHSKHGAIQEAKHVFIKNGLSLFSNQEISILEIGFGTGLNSFITFLEAQKLDLEIDYVGVEAYPVSKNEIDQLNYVTALKATKFSSVFDAMHSQSWDVKSEVSALFHLTKRHQFFNEIQDVNYFNLIYFDAFGARVQPELWTEAIFKIMYDALKEKGVLVTYSAKGSVRRAMQSVGFIVERLPGPPGKREMLRATK
ncbi:MAG: tRNA (5-methylaminomethyl-2-thiouridine)(34)-methyltransferase MnmD [Lutibacter sp.]|uniref:tRNA (5-methylaminomethyl-2-thiouridine)(34)-methyltransferase MnmD n=1 Tax=Lutibacter sp. TaxID=1925666 RepID=UPI0018461BFC|nr:tRNA (5-methylaminomethyl-2-thiouridine)(34)-methyltransferase MnmD [Lutibacter sp.]MBT8318289.1 tRNA (5-methylaminomethyl-2-thiouridine)(34)-methyltransferase MnmD [Lutibacter sp.]NNJ59146.1 tRNA (5-methylaminomethyl-2-thiouridine)(34)-methyltransferase MnmD [Lutibacter sp.]